MERLRHQGRSPGGARLPGVSRGLGVRTYDAVGQPPLPSPPPPPKVHAHRGPATPAGPEPEDSWVDRVSRDLLSGIIHDWARQEC